MHNLSASFILGYHGCDAAVAERLLRNEPFLPSTNQYDWLGTGIYFWEANPLRGLEFATETAARRPDQIETPAVIGAVIDLGYCLDLTTSLGLREAGSAFLRLRSALEQADSTIPKNRPELFLHDRDCAVLNYLHWIRKEEGRHAFDTVKGIFIEQPLLYEGSAFGTKNHIQIAVRNPACIKGVFRVPDMHLDPRV
ncbi:hypothetical protein SAMN05421771_1595 [Granulicella pectinivorans]|uniref:Uncharacterized protein n=1 Tax=Granulicella pectinivorans TaxID=474950 RepID=A0A1I6M096_9BACT|nr:hypothetical protein [Granulicella pectinivorans]SFS09117.1 hypothetical protein SAMN05421771_1595 [Granulicella pectinivorans]